MYKPVILARSIAEVVAFKLILAGSVAKEVALERDGLGWRLMEASALAYLSPPRASLAAAVYIDIDLDAGYRAGGIQEGA